MDINDGAILIQNHVSMHNTDTPLDQSHDITKSSDEQPTKKDVPPTTGGEEKHVSATLTVILLFSLDKPAIDINPPQKEQSEEIRTPVLD